MMLLMKKNHILKQKDKLKNIFHKTYGQQPNRTVLDIDHSKDTVYSIDLGYSK